MLDEHALALDTSVAEQGPVEMIRTRAMLEKQCNAGRVLLIYHSNDAVLAILVCRSVLEQQLQAAQILELARVIERLAVADFRAAF